MADSFSGTKVGSSQGESGSASSLVQFENSQPIFQPVKVNDKSRSYDALADIFGKVSEIAMGKAQSIAKQHSTSQLMTANSFLHDVSNSARMEMMKDSTPENVRNILDKWQYTVGTIKDSTPLNPEDKLKLDELIDTKKNQLELHGETLSEKNITDTKKRIYYGDLSVNTQTLNDLMRNGKYDEAEKLGQSMYENALNNLKSGTITGTELMSQQRGLLTIINKAMKIHDVIQHGKDITARDYHELYAFPFGSGEDDSQLPGKPRDESSFQLSRIHLDDISYRGQLSSAITHGQYDPQAIAQLPEHQQYSVIKAAAGAEASQSYLTSNTGWPSFISKYNELRSQPDHSLSTYDKGMRDHMQYVISSLNNGNYNKIIDDTVMGSEVNQRFQIQASSINDGKLYNLNNPDDVIKQYNANVKNLNDLISGRASIGISQHMPNEWIQPIDLQVSEPVRQAFSFQGNVQDAIKGMSALYPVNKIYLVNAMKNQKQQEVMRTVALSDQSTNTEFLNDFIGRNQDGLDYTQLKVTGVKDTKIRAKLQSSMPEIMDYMYRNGNATTFLGRSIGSEGGSQIVQSGINRQSAFIEAGMNWVKGEALKHNDFEMNNIDTYVDDFAKNISSTHDLMTGYNYQINNKNLGINLTKQSADAIANMATIDALDRLHKNHNESEYMNALDRNPLYVTIDQYNNIVAVDIKSKKIVYHMPFSQSYLDHALSKQRELNIETKEEFYQKTKALELFAGKEVP